MYEFYIEFESYWGNRESMIVSADTESDARRVFHAMRPLSEIRNVERSS